MVASYGEVLLQLNGGPPIPHYLFYWNGIFVDIYDYFVILDDPRQLSSSHISTPPYQVHDD